MASRPPGGLGCRNVVQTTGVRGKAPGTSEVGPRSSELAGPKASAPSLCHCAFYSIAAANMCDPRNPLGHDASDLRVIRHLGFQQVMDDKCLQVDPQDGRAVNVGSCTGASNQKWKVPKPQNFASFVLCTCGTSMNVVFRGSTKVSAFAPMTMLTVVWQM